MNQKITSIVKKSVKVGAAVCVAAGAIALMTSDAALKALTVGGKYLKDAVRKIIGDTPEANVVVVEAVEKMPVAEPVEEAAVMADTSVNE